MKRTGNCKKCGCIEFKLVPKIGEVEYICADCGEHVNTIDYGHYITVKNTCSNCSSDRFKATVTSEQGISYWDTVCAICGSEISQYYADKNGDEIDRNTREILVIGDYIQEIQGIIIELKDEIGYTKEELSNIENEDSNIGSHLNNCMDNIYKLDEKVKEFEEEIMDLKGDTD